MMIHGFAPEYAGQGRGYSRLAFALQEFQNLTDFSMATIRKAINQSQVHMYVKPSPDAPASNPFEALLTNAGAGPAAKQFGAIPQPSTDATGIVPQALNPVTYFEMPEATMAVPGSTAVFNLESGEDLKPFEGKVASESFNTFVDAFCGYLCSAAGMPLEVLLMKFNQNYSASRATLILFWRVVNVWRQEMICSYCDPTYEMWLSGEIAAGRVFCPGWQDPRLRAAWLSCRWQGSPMPNIDPEKTSKADMNYIEMGAQTLDTVSRNLNGSSGKANRARLVREIGELTVPPWSKGSQSTDDTGGTGDAKKKQEDDNNA
jgi:capsid protein